MTLFQFQSMLCSPNCSQAVADRVLSLLEKSTTMPGWDSVWILCKIRSKVTDTFQVLVQKYPAVILSYGTSVLGSDPEVVSDLGAKSWKERGDSIPAFFLLLHCRINVIGHLGIRRNQPFWGQYSLLKLLFIPI